MYLIYEDPPPWPALGCPNLSEILPITAQLEGGEGAFIWGLLVPQSYAGPILLSGRPMIVSLDMM